MYKLYFLLFLLAVVCGAYFAGGQVAHQRCNARVGADVVAQQLQIMKIQGDINAEAYNSNTGDIRRVLRERYTIAE